MRRWDHQTRAQTAIWSAIDRGVKRLAVASPTGSGKTRMMEDVVLRARERGLTVSINTHRKLLFEQVTDYLSSVGIEHGCRASGYEPRFELPVQVVMLQTEHARAHRAGGKWMPNKCDIGIFDEIHTIMGQQTADIMATHDVCVGFTATPLDIAPLWDELYVAASNSECRACGALVMANTYVGGEPSAKLLKQDQEGSDFTSGSLNKAFCVKPIFGKVLEHYHRINPEQHPTLLFGPDVRGSIWFAEMFTAHGVRAAHIDGEDAWFDGEFQASNRETREWIIEKFREGEIKVLCNRFVLREGVNIPETRHAIFATAFGSLTSYLQAGGRVLRAYPGKEVCTIQDHGGNWHRHDSLNDDRDWSLDDNSHILAATRAEMFREQNADPASHKGQDGEPVLCPKCHRPRRVVIGEDWKTCPYCGHRCATKSRYVWQTNGKLEAVEGDVYKRRRRQAMPNDERDWERMYHRAKRSRNKMTFAQAEALFAREHYWIYPRRDMKLMPKNPSDWFRPVASVEPSSLT